MLTFEPVSQENLYELKPYFKAQRTRLSDFSLGFLFMWQKHLSLEFTLAAGCLILREHFSGKIYYHYPVSLNGSDAEENEAIALIENHCRDSAERLNYTNVPGHKVFPLMMRGGQQWGITNIRRWRDYLYRADDFKSYAGGKYSGQRNHVNKFKKSYPDWSFRIYKAEDEAALTAFLKDYESVQRAKKNHLANEEMNEVFALAGHIAEYGLLCGLLTAGQKIVACAVGERCGDTLMIHVEKALRDYEGVYPCVAQEFAKAFCTDGVNYINRMDDAGDGGLRKSKLQYLPCEILDKFTVMPHRPIDGLKKIPVLKTERLRLAPVTDKYAEDYRRLASDRERNKFWGYDWAEDHKSGEPSARWFLDLARSEFREKREMSFGIFCGEKLIGEAVLHRFGYRSEVEAGVRLLPEAEGKGYAQEAVKRLAEYAFLELGIERVEAKRYLPNERSGAMLERAGMRRCGQDDKFIYYYKTPSM